MSNYSVAKFPAWCQIIQRNDIVYFFKQYLDQGIRTSNDYYKCDIKDKICFIKCLVSAVNNFGDIVDKGNESSPYEQVFKISKSRFNSSDIKCVGFSHHPKDGIYIDALKKYSSYSLEEIKEIRLGHKPSDDELYESIIQALDAAL